MDLDLAIPALVMIAGAGVVLLAVLVGLIWLLRRVLSIPKILAAQEEQTILLRRLLERPEVDATNVALDQLAAGASLEEVQPHPPTSSPEYVGRPARSA